MAKTVKMPGTVPETTTCNLEWCRSQIAHLLEHAANYTLLDHVGVPVFGAGVDAMRDHLREALTIAEHLCGADR